MPYEVDTKLLLETIYQKASTKPSLQTYTDLRDMCREAMKNDTALGVEYLVKLSAELEKHITDSEWGVGDVRKLFFLHKSVLLLAAPYH